MQRLSTTTEDVGIKWYVQLCFSTGIVVQISVTHINCVLILLLDTAFTPSTPFMKREHYQSKYMFECPRHTIRLGILDSGMLRAARM